MLRRDEATQFHTMRHCLAVELKNGGIESDTRARTTVVRMRRRSVDPSGGAMFRSSTFRFSTRPLHRHLALIAAAALSVACNTSDHTDPGPTAPISPAQTTGPQHYFEVVLGPGTTGTPSVSSNYPSEQRVAYSFSATDGVSDVFVATNGYQISPSGFVVMNIDQRVATFISNLPGAHAVDFAGQTWDGTTVRLSALRGKTVLFNVVDPTCFASAIEAPQLQQIYATYHAKGLEVITLFAQTADSSVATAADLQAWVGTWGLTYPVINDPRAAYKVYYRELLNCSSLECSGWPNNYIVDGSGVIIYRSSGFNGPELLAKLATLFP
jgi:peroxiredoxin